MDEKEKFQSFSGADNCFNRNLMETATNKSQRNDSGSSDSGSSDSGSSDSGSSDSGSSDSDSSESGSSSTTNTSSNSDSSDNESVTEDLSANVEKSESKTTFSMDDFLWEKYLDRQAIEFKSEWPEIESDLAASRPSLMRAPNFMPFNQKPYEMRLHENDATPEDLADCESREAFLTKLKTTVRWREAPNNATGELIKESNARIVRWSDGSQTFHVGAEAFDVKSLPLSGAMNQFYLRSGNYYRAHCPIKEKLTLRPKLESSFGMSHVQGMRKRAINKPSTSGVKILTDLSTNPVVERGRRIREESALLRKGNQRYSSVQPMQHYSTYKYDYNK